VCLVKDLSTRLTLVTAVHGKRRRATCVLPCYSQPCCYNRPNLYL